MGGDSSLNIDVINLRKGMIAELDTVNEYVKMMDECTDEHAKEVFKSIIEEELVHVGEFEEAINRICPIQQIKITDGIMEASTIGDPKYNPIIKLP